MKKVISAKGAPAALGPYSHAILKDHFLFTSGQVPLTEGGTLAGDDFKIQAVQVFKNLEAVLKASGMTFSDVVKTTVYLTDLNDFSVLNEIYASYFISDPPARSCVQVAALPAGAKLEIELIASKKH